MKSATLYVFLAVVSQYHILATLRDAFPIVDRPALYKVLETSPHQHVPVVAAKKEAYTQSKVAPRCGEVLTRGTDGGIFYKPFEQVLANERCVWIIAPPRAIGYDINILFLGNQTNEEGTNQELIITEIRRGSDQPSLTSYKPITTGFLNITSGTILLVTFSTSTTDETAFGFALQYDQRQSTGVQNNSTHHIIEPSSSDFKYPPNSTTYGYNELAAIVLPPVNNLYTGEGHLNVFKQLELECTPDDVFIYKFNTSVAAGQEKWQYATSLCEAQNAYQLRYDDLTLAIFQSDDTIVESGFTISSYAGCSF